MNRKLCFVELRRRTVRFYFDTPTFEGDPLWWGQFHIRQEHPDFTTVQQGFYRVPMDEFCDDDSLSFRVDADGWRWEGYKIPALPKLLEGEELLNHQKKVIRESAEWERQHAEDVHRNRSEAAKQAWRRRKAGRLCQPSLAGLFKKG